MAKALLFSSVTADLAQRAVDLTNGKRPPILRGLDLSRRSFLHWPQAARDFAANCSGPPTTVAIAPATKEQDQHYDNNQYCHITHSFQPGRHTTRSNLARLNSGMLLPRIS